MRNRFTVVLLILAIVAISGSCVQWKVVSMKPKTLMYLKNGENPGDVAVYTDEDEYALDNLSFQVAVSGRKICVADNNLRRIQVFSQDGEVQLVIGSTRGLEGTKIPSSRFNFNTVGCLAIDSKGRVYAQNRLSHGSAAGNTDNDFNPSYILVFDSRGKLEYTLGQRGTPDMPFYYIDSMDVDDNGRLFVISRSFESWTVFRFTGKKRDYYINLGEISFTEQDGTETYKGKIEKVCMFRGGDKLIIAVAYYMDMRLKYRKIFSYDLESARLDRTLVTMPDPRNTLFTLVDDRTLYFWNVEDGEVKFMITGLDGELETNVRLDFDDSRNYYSQIIIDEKGRLYSYHVTRKGIELIEWQ